MSKFEYTYYTCLTNNSDSQFNELIDEPNLVFNEQRQQPIITKTSDYEMAITNFKLDTKCLPSFIPIIKHDTNPNISDKERLRTIYELTYSVKKDGQLYSFTQPLYFKPQDETISGVVAPNFINGYADYKSGFYNLYNYENFFTVLNTAVKKGMYGLQRSYDNYHGDGSFESRFSDQANILDMVVPYFIFDKDSGLSYCNSPVKNFNVSKADGISLYLNAPLYRLFDSFPFSFKKVILNTISESDDGQTNKISKEVKLFQLNFNNFETSNTIMLYPKVMAEEALGTLKIEHYVIYQDYETMSSWTPVESVVLTSNTLPIKSSIVSSNHSFVLGKETTEGTSNMIEMELSEFRAGLYKAGVIYEPKQFRWLNLLDMDELKHINFQVFYRLKSTGQLIPLKINSGGSFGLKICFRKLKN